MIPVQRFASGVLAELVRRQPPSKARTDFAWQFAVGSAIARATVVELKDGVLTVTATDARWIQELKRARDVVLARLQDMMGPGQIARIKWNTPDVTASAEASASPPEHFARRRQVGPTRLRG